MGKKILCVEDNPTNSEIITVILERMDYEVLVVSEGRAAISMALKFNPDLILMDLHLPGMNGVEVTLLMKAHEKLAHIPIIAITADIYARQSFFDAGGNAYLTKPIRSGSLLRVIEQVIGEQAAK